jgi:hypothetical protein
LTGPSYSENASGNVGTGTILLNAPAGFLFDTSGTAPTMLVTRLTGSGSNGNNINGVASGTAVAMTSIVQHATGVHCDKFQCQRRHLQADLGRMSGSALQPAARWPAAISR